MIDSSTYLPAQQAMVRLPLSAVDAANRLLAAREAKRQAAEQEHLAKVELIAALQGTTHGVLPEATTTKRDD